MASISRIVQIDFYAGFMRDLVIGCVALSSLGEATRILPRLYWSEQPESPYVINVPNTVDIIALLTVGDSVNDKPVSEESDL